MAAVQIQWPRRLRTAMVLYIVIAFLHVITGDVPDGFVYTDLHRVARKGDELVLKCEFFGPPFAVYWKKGDDPIESPNLIKWGDEGHLSGSCIEDRSCKIDDDFSLIINQTKIANEGRYICLVSNYLGVLIDNYTDVSVFAPPLEPYPIIDGCPSDTEGTCSIATSDTVSITCSASNYFPDVDLFFLLGSQEMETISTKESINNDDTKNKSISTLATASETPYICVASDIPGSQARRTATVLVSPRTATVSMITSHYETTSPPGGGVAKVVIPITLFIILLIVVCVVITLWYWKKKRRTPGKDDEEAVPLNSNPHIDGQISFFELWCLVTNMDETALQKLRVALINLGLIIRDEGLTADVAYEVSCSWKDTNKHRKEGKILREKLCEIGDSWKNMCDRRWDTRTKASEDILEHIVRTIGNERKIALFLRKLIPEHPLNRDGITTTEAMKALLRWRDENHNESQSVLLSLALETAQCRPVDREFFKVPDHLMRSISSQEVEGFVDRLTRRHCSRIAMAVGITNENKIRTIIDENNKDLFDTQSMVSEWIAREECSNYEKRCRLDDAIIKIGRHDMTDFFGTTVHRAKNNGNPEKQHPHAKAFRTGSIFDDDLEGLLKYLPNAAITLFLERLGIPVEEDGKTIKEMLRDWRDKTMRDSKHWSLQELVAMYNEVLKETNDSHVFDLIDDELEFLAKNITCDKMEDLLSILHIDDQHEQSPLQCLKEWRDNTQMEKRRQTLRKALRDIGLSGYIVDRRPEEHVYEVEMVRLAFSVLCNDVGPLAKLLGMDTNKGKLVREPMKGTVGLLLQLLKKSKCLKHYRRRDFSIAVKNIGYLDVARLAYFEYDEGLTVLYNLTIEISQDEMEKLMNLLKEETAVLSIWRETTGLPNHLALMKMLRSQYRSEPFHYSLKLALGLQAIGRTDIADEVLAGRLQTTDISSIVDYTCHRMEVHHLERLSTYLGLKTQDNQIPSTSDMSEILEGVTKWMKEINPTVIVQDKHNIRRLENNDLFKNGSFELAEEIMLLELPTFPSD